MDSLSSLINKHYRYSNDIILSCHQALHELYPELNVRWARIYGRRWAFIHGRAADAISFSTLKVQLSTNYGLCIDNANTITPPELDAIRTTLREYFRHDAYFEN
ncbi:hypothetical protein [Syntrophomonas curvata]